MRVLCCRYTSTYVVYHYCFAVTVAEKKVKFGLTSKGKQAVLHKQYEFVKHRHCANGTVQWRCKLHQKSHCPARLTTDGDQIVSDADPEHNHASNRESVLARQAVSEMKAKMGDLAATTTSVIGLVSRDLEPGVLMALPTKQSLKRSLQRKRRYLQTVSDSTSLPPPPTDATFTIPQVFQ